MTSALLGARVVNTRASHQAHELDDLLRESGAISLPYPCIAIAPPEKTDQLDAAIGELLSGRFDWLVLTSTNAVNALSDRLRATSSTASLPSSLKLAVVGEATQATVANRLGLPVAFVSTESTGKALARELPIDVNARVLLPVSEIASPEPAAILRERGANMTSVVAYRTVAGSGGVELPALLRQGAVDAITFTSPSTIFGCLARLVAEGGAATELNQLAIVTIGPTTQSAAQTHGLQSAVMAQSPSMRALVEALDRALEQKQSQGGAVWLSRSSA